MHGPFGLAVVLVAFSLYIAAETLDWPATADIDAAFD